MKRFLILSILIVFVIAGCAAPNKVGWKKPDFRQDEFEKDREDCIQAAKVNPEQNISVEQCLAKKGYESEPEPSSDEEKANTAETAKTVGKVLLLTGAVALYVGVVVAVMVAGALIGL